MGQSVVSFLEQSDWAGLAGALGFEAYVPLGGVGQREWGLDCLSGCAIHVASGGSTVRLVVVDGAPERRHGRAAMHEVQRRNPTGAVLWWWIEAERLVVSTLVDSDDGRWRERRMAIARRHPEAVGLRQLEDLRVTGVLQSEERERGRAVRGHFAEILSQERVTRAFFVGFRDALERLKRDMTNGPPDAESRHQVALVTLLRLLFLYFLQARGAFENDRRYVLRRWRGRTPSDSFYRAALRPLFFGVLNTPIHERLADAESFGHVPFLNGGLFDATPAEREFAGLDWPNDVWAFVIEGLLEHYHFEYGSSSDAQSCAIDPEMLGKVFEGLMLADVRSSTGSFYTPPDVVRHLVRTGLASTLADRTGWTTERVGAIFDVDQIDLETRDTLRTALRGLALVDPAVGTGAFLLEALERLRHLWTLIDGPVDHVRLRSLIHDHLHGVDINPTATRLCELRLWIELLGATPDHAIANMPPLPNLSHRIVTGDALIDPLDLVTRRRGNGGTFAPTRQLRGPMATALQQLQSEYLTCHGSRKTDVRRALEAAERAMTIEVIEQRLARLNAQAVQFQKALDAPTLLADAPSAGHACARALADVERERRELETMVCEVASDHRGWAMSWLAKFPQVCAAGGFDLVLTNPPWVRMHRVSRVTREHLTLRYGSTRTPRLWRGAARRGIQTSFGTQFDLANVFLERSLELVRPGGHVVALVPAKMFRSLQGTAIRQMLAKSDVLRVEDYSERHGDMFDATTYPAMLHVRQSNRHPSTQVVVWRGTTSAQWQMHLPDDGHPWQLVPSDVASVLSKMAEASNATLEPARGVFTAANDLFLGTRDDLLERYGTDVAPWLRPVHTGSDLAALRRFMVYPYDADSTAPVQLPAAAARAFERERERLEARADHDPKSVLWQVFRTRHDTLGPKVLWRDIARRLEPLVAEGGVPLNTVYYLPAHHIEHAESLASLLASAPIQAAARAITERARGGYRRHFAWCIRMLPVTQKIVSACEHGRIWSNLAVAEALGLTARDLEVLEVWLRSESAP